MAVVGEASVIVRAVTTGVKNDIQRAFNGTDRISERAGSDAGSSFSRGFNKSNNIGALFGKSISQRDINVFTQARQQFLSLARVGYSLGAALTVLGGVLGSLIGGLGVLVSITGAATPALLGLTGAILAVAAAAGVLRAAFKGVGEAISAGNKIGEKAKEDAEALEAANFRLADAYYNLDETVRQNAKRKEDAVEAEFNAAIAVADAAIAVERAERTYQGAVKNTEKALEAVTEAREAAKEAIQQLRFELEGGVISEKKARLEFEKARDSLQRVQDLPPNSRARREAELAFAEADLNLRRAIDKNNDLRKATTKQIVKV
jgi:tetratricopeptide (TPR) repeat protein